MTADPRRAAACVVVRGDHVLLVVHRARGRIELPAGKCADGESFAEAAARGLAEETGLVARVEHLHRLGELHVPGWVCAVYWAEAWSGEPRAGDDAARVFWGLPATLLLGTHPAEAPLAEAAVRRAKALGGEYGRDG